jgi:hypothetical protein
MLGKETGAARTVCFAAISARIDGNDDDDGDDEEKGVG